MLRSLFWFAMIPITAISHGLAMTLLWGWFLVPMGLPPINVAQAIGVSSALFFARTVPVIYKDIKVDSDASAFAQIVVPWVCVLVGYVAKWWA